MAYPGYASVWLLPPTVVFGAGSTVATGYSFSRQAGNPPFRGRTRGTPRRSNFSAILALEASFGQVQNRMISRSSGNVVVPASSSAEDRISAPGMVNPSRRISSG